MKLIQSSAHLKPFCHEGARYALVPSTNLFLRIYPTKITFFLAEKTLKLVEEWEFDLQGPFENFTWEMDILHKKLCIHFQKGKDSYYLVFISKENGVFLIVKRLPNQGLKMQTKKGGKQLKKKQELLLDFEGLTSYFSSCVPRLFLGSKKAQNLQKIAPKQDLAFWLPHYFQLSFYYSQISQSKPSLNFPAFQALASAEKNTTHQAFFNLLSHHFDSYFLPSFNDPHCLRIFPSASENNPLSLYTTLYPLLLSLFVVYRPQELHLLPKLPPELHTGKLIGLQVNDTFSMSLYWSKKKIRQVEIYAHQAFTLALHPGQEIKTFRMYSRSKKQAKTLCCKEKCSFSANTRVYFDRFEK